MYFCASPTFSENELSEVTHILTSSSSPDDLLYTAYPSHPSTLSHVRVTVLSVLSIDPVRVHTASGDKSPAYTAAGMKSKSIIIPVIIFFIAILPVLRTVFSSAPLQAISHLCILFLRRWKHASSLRSSLCAQSLQACSL